MVASSEQEPVILQDESAGPFEGKLYHPLSYQTLTWHYFIGPEKLLELWFSPSERDVVDRGLPLKGGRKGKKRWTGLRQVERSTWEGMLDEVQCKVLSVIEGEEMDAYLLRFAQLSLPTSNYKLT